MINNLNNRMVEIVKNKLAECYEEISNISIILNRKFFEEVIIKFENDMYNYFNTNYQTCVRFGDDLLRFKVRIFDIDRLLKEVLKDE